MHFLKRFPTLRLWLIKLADGVTRETVIAYQDYCHKKRDELANLYEEKIKAMTELYVKELSQSRADTARVMRIYKEQQEALEILSKIVKTSDAALKDGEILVAGVRFAKVQDQKIVFH